MAPDSAGGLWEKGKWEPAGVKAREADRTKIETVRPSAGEMVLNELVRLFGGYGTR